MTTDHTREALADAFDEIDREHGAMLLPDQMADALLASDWLAAHDAALVDGRDASIQSLKDSCGEWAEEVAGEKAMLVRARAEIERLRGAATEVERLSDTYTVEGTEIVMQRIIDLRRERDEARAALAVEREKIAAVEASCRQQHVDTQLLASAKADGVEAVARTLTTLARSSTDGGDAHE